MCLIKQNLLRFKIFIMDEIKRNLFTFKMFTILFQLSCIIATVGMIAFWCYEYHLNNDLCLVDYKSYYADPKNDVPPVMSLCFNPFPKDTFEHNGETFNTSEYVAFLSGKIILSPMH